MSSPSWPELPWQVRSRHYAHAPIAEAIIDIRCESADAPSLEVLRTVVDDPAYGEPEKLMNLLQTLNFSDDGVEGTTTQQQIGHVFRRDDGHRIVQARLDGFGFSWLGLYETWEKFEAEAEMHWLRYRAVVAPTRVTRLGVRYINRIDVPAPGVEIKDYLRVSVDVPPYLPQLVSGYFMQVAVPLERFGCTATITSTLLQPPDQNATSLLLDVDTWESANIELTGDDVAEAVKERLAALREAKNYVFESCITDATRGLIS